MHNNLKDSSLKASDFGAWIFDLDNTLYPSESNLFSQVDWKMTAFIAELLNIEKEEARNMQKTYFREYGTTLRGLMINQNIDPKDFLDFVHDIDYSIIKENQSLVEILSELPGEKYIFTNGTVAHAENVLQQLGIQSEIFTGIFDIIAADYIPKPDQAPYQEFVKSFAIDCKKAIFFEDIAINLKVPHNLGMRTVWLKNTEEWSSEGADDAHVHHQTTDITQWLHEALYA